MTESAAATPGRRGRVALLAVAVGAFAVAALGAAYLNWIWWVPSYGGEILIGLAAATVLIVGGIAAVIGRRFARVKRIALVILAVGIGIAAGEALGPTREPYVVTDGTLTLRLTSPVVATAAGAASCRNVASATEFAVNGDGNTLIEAGDRPAVSIFLDVGDRWEALRATPRKDGVWLRIDVTGRLITDAGKPGTLSMQATSSSTLTSTFSNGGGSITFAGLTAQAANWDFTGESMDLAGTLEWTCEGAPALAP